MDGPRRRDPLAALVLGAGAVLALALAAYLVYSISSDPPAADSKGPDLAALREAARNLADRVPKPEKISPAEKAPGNFSAQIPAGVTWTYAVQVEPPIWRDITLAYRTVQGANGF